VSDTPDPGSRSEVSGVRGWASALVPVALLALLIVALVQLDPLGTLRGHAPPIENLTFDRVVLRADPDEIDVTVVNGGADPVTVAQVIVDDAYWPHTIEPSSRVDPLRSATIHVAYPWVAGEPLDITIITSTGLTFAHTIQVGLATPTLTGRTLVDLALLGAFVGLVPVMIGLSWFPFVRRLGSRRISLLLAFTIGILVFLAFEATVEALDLAPRVPPALDGVAVFLVGVVVAVATLIAIGSFLRRRGRGPGAESVAVLIALGIGLHNFGEGLAISAAYSLGEVTLTSLLVIGFAIHNSTEGLAIVTPLSGSRPSLGLLATLGIVAGAPTIAGTWLGAFAYSPSLAIAFLGLGVGAIVQVVRELAAVMDRGGELAHPSNVVGVAAGIVAMYVTGLAVQA